MVFSNIYFIVKEGNCLKKTRPYMRMEISVNANFPSGGIVFEKHSDGYRMQFPVRMRALLGFSPKSHVKLGDKVVEKLRVYIEKVSN